MLSRIKASVLWVLIVLSTIWVISPCIQVMAEPSPETILATILGSAIYPTTRETFLFGNYEITPYEEYTGNSDQNTLIWYETGTSDFNLIFDGSESVPPGTPMGMVSSSARLFMLIPEHRNWFPETSGNDDAPPGTVQYPEVYQSMYATQGTFGPEDIVFETGYESGIKPFGWDACVGMPGGETYSRITSSTSHARGGTKSVKLHKAPPVNSNADRRLEMRWYDTPKDVYVSWWVYFDNRWNTQDPVGWGTNLGGVQAYWGVDGDFTYWTSLRFMIEPSDREILAKYHFSDFGDGTPYGTTETKYYYFSPKKYITDYLNQWVHFQVHLKFSTTNTGEYQAWFNDELICEDYGLKTDPEGYAGWSKYEWTRGRYGGPWVVNELYSTKDSMETWFWVDDTVCATEKVPEYYRVE